MLLMLLLLLNAIIAINAINAINAIIAIKCYVMQLNVWLLLTAIACAFLYPHTLSGNITEQGRHMFPQYSGG